MPRSLKLERPLIFIDIQTTGLDIRSARIVRLSTLRIEPDGTEEFKSKLLNPLAPISPGASEVHGITDDQVADEPTFASFARALMTYLAGCDLAGFGIRRFHLKVLESELLRAGIKFDWSGVAIVDAMEIFHKLEPRDMPAAYRRFVGRDYIPSSDVEDRVDAVRQIVNGQLTADQSIPKSPSAIDSWIRGVADQRFIDEEGRFIWIDEGDAIINFGKFRGHALYDLYEHQPDYLRWIAENDAFTDLQREIAEDAANGIVPRME